jgi:restriction system protein
MAVPNFQEFMLPFLRAVSDGREHTIAEMFGVMAKHFNLSEEDIKELVPSGRETRFKNRVYWARVYLAQAKLIDATGRGRFRITDRGSTLLKSNPPTINMKLLEQYPEYVAFKGRSVKKSDDGNSVVVASSETDEKEEQLTPEELLESSYTTLRQQLIHALLEQIMNSPPESFEQLVIDVLVAMGYGGSRVDAGQAIGKSNDGGIDGIIKEDRLGLDVVYLQAKRWTNNVGSPEIQGFVGSLNLNGANKGVFITTSSFSKPALDIVKGLRTPKVVLIDGQQLAEMMIDYGVGVSDVATYTVKKLNPDYFDLE